MVRPIGVDLFAGAGGLSLGFEQAGFDVVAAVEIDPIHAAIHAFNFPNCAVIAESVQKLSGADIRKRAGIGKLKVDVVFGGAPCQGFSMMGRRMLDDPRNALVRDFVRIVKELDANYFVFENVKGITVGKHAKFLDELIEAFNSVGYVVKLPWRVLNAASYGVPQDRERLILMGCKKGLPLPEYPEPTTRGAGSSCDVGSLPEGPSCADALGDVPDAEKFDELWSTDAVTVKWGVPSNYAKGLRDQSYDASNFGYEREWNPRLLTSSLRTEHTPLSRERFLATDEGKVEPISRFFKLPSKGTSNTLRAGTDSARGAFTSPRPIHYKYARCITVREMARLHSFPDWFRFHPTKWHGARQIGNAVPPLLGRAVAAKLMQAMGKTPERPDQRIALGSETLLAMDMQQASAHFGIPVPIAQRNRKVPTPNLEELSNTVESEDSDALDVGNKLVKNFTL